MTAQTNRIPELLAPAGEPKAFYAALAGGADAIYCALGNDFNARRMADNFTPETFERACRDAHLAGARVYVTINIVIQDDEMERALATVVQAWKLGADAFIIQDWGLFDEIRRRWPEVECHISTQANIHDARGVRWCGEHGAERVTLSRELSLPEIAAISHEGVDLECFGHGAICFCYSGICLMSSFFGGRSANRGICAQPCRLPYELVDERGENLLAPGRERPLCPKDFYSFEDLAAMAEAGVGSLKVEGRMKSPDYVYAVISAYRGALDDLAAGRPPAPGEDAARKRQLKRAFNRDFTDAYLKGTSGNELMSYERSNNRGELVGSVLFSEKLEDELRASKPKEGERVRLRRHPRARLRIMLSAPVGAGDLLEIRPSSDISQFFTAPVSANAQAGDEIEVIGVRTADIGSDVRVIRSQAAFDDVDRALSRPIVRKRAVDVRIRARLGEPFSVEIACPESGVSARAEGFIVEAARTKEVGEDELVEHACRMGTTPFEPRAVSCELDAGCGMGFSAVHAVRAEACAKLEQALLAPYAQRNLEMGTVPFSRSIDNPEKGTVPECRSHEAEVCALVATPEAAEAARSAGATRIYASADALAEGTWPAGVIPWLDEVCREADRARLDAAVIPASPVAVGTMSGFAHAVECGADPEVRPCIPVHNASTIAAFERWGAVSFWLSPELTLEQIGRIAPSATVPVGMVISGRVRVMTSEHCVLQAADRCIHDCARCSLRTRDLRLKNIDGHLLPVRTDIHGRSRIYSAWPIDLTPQIPELLRAGVSRFMSDGTLLDPEQTARAVTRIIRALEAADAGRRPAEKDPNTMSGHLFAGIG